MAPLGVRASGQRVGNDGACVIEAARRNGSYEASGEGQPVGLL